MATTMALEQYFFWVSLISSCILGTVWILAVFVLLRSDLHNLAVSRHRTAHHTQQNKNDDEYAFGAQPLIQLQADVKAKKNATGHGETELHYNL